MTMMADVSRVVVKKRMVAIDLFCGAGGLTCGMLDAGIEVVAGYDIDDSCRYAYEQNNKPALFKNESVVDLKGSTLSSYYPDDAYRILVGCAPCQPFSRYTRGTITDTDEKWGLLSHYGRLIGELNPDVLSMENVCGLQRHEVYSKFLALLQRLDYYYSAYEIFCPDYGIPQNRKRLVLFASKSAPISLIPPTHDSGTFCTVETSIGKLPKISAGEISMDDPLHRASNLSERNLQRIRYSHPGGTWREWPNNIVSKCHRRKEGKTFPSVYGRMEWKKPSPTITTQFYGYGNGRFGHPEQNRALSLREGAMLQTFPSEYKFVRPGDSYHYKAIGRMIGNAVPVQLGTVIGKTIINHLEKQNA